LPSNEGRGYVLRRIIRRAIRHGSKLSEKGVFFHKLVASLVEQMGDAYPELRDNQTQIEKVLLAEEEQFAKTLDKGMAVLETKLGELDGKVISGDVVFTLYDTYGFPVDLTNDIARERGLGIDAEAYEALMAEQKKKSKEAGSFKVDYNQNIVLEGQTTFSGYEGTSAESKVVSIIKDGDETDAIGEGDHAAIVLETTPFYAESGGQVGDSGIIEVSGRGRFEVLDCQKSGSHHLHVGRLVSGEIRTNDSVVATIDSEIRAATARNHSATHLLHAALRDVLGDHVTQKGSLNDSERLRFDFSHFEALTKEQLEQVNEIVNNQIMGNSAVLTDLCDMDEAKNKGAMALFGEKYGDQVRVLTMGSNAYSVELCGGTHVDRTGDIGLFYITSEAGIASGVRRIEAVTAAKSMAAVTNLKRTHQELAQKLKSSPEALAEKLDGVLAQNKAMEKELAQLKAKLASASADEWVSEAVEVKGLKLLVKTLEGADNKSLRDTVDKLKDKLGTSAVLLAGVNNGKIALVAGVSKDATSIVKAGDLVKHVASQVGGKGGGRPDMAQGGGTDVSALPAAMDSVSQWLS